MANSRKKVTSGEGRPTGFNDHLGKPCRLVLVEWSDSSYEAGWNTDDLSTGEFLCKSVGWLVHDGDKTKVLASNVGVNRKDGCLHRCGAMIIPVQSISKIHEIG